MPERSLDRPASAVIWSWRSGPVDRTGEIRAARRSGLLRGGIGLAVAAALFFWKPTLGAVAGAVALGLLAVALASPGGLYRIERALAAFAHAVGVAVSWVALTIVFFLVVLPVGLLLRATGRLRLARRPDPEAASYWRVPNAAAAAPSHNRQF